MKRPYQITGALLVLFAILVARESLQLRFYTTLGPGPGFFPLLISFLLALMGAIMVYQATFGQPDPMAHDFYPSRTGYLRVAAIILSIAFGAFLMESLGFRLTMLSILLFMLYALGRQRILTTVLVALAGSMGAHYAFTQWLKVPLPIGILGI